MERRMQKTLEVLGKEKEILKLKSTIKANVQQKINEQHRKAMLYEEVSLCGWQRAD